MLLIFFSYTYSKANEAKFSVSRNDVTRTMWLSSSIPSIKITNAYWTSIVSMLDTMSDKTFR